MDNKVYALDANGNVKTGWPYSTQNAVASSPAIAADGTIYVGSFDGKLHAIYPSGGSKWVLTLSGAGVIRSSPAVGTDGVIYVGAQNGKLYAVESSGTQKWAAQTGSNIWSSPVIGADGSVFAGSYDGKLYAVDLLGSNRWAYAIGSPLFSSPVLAENGVLYFGALGYGIYAVPAETFSVHRQWPMFRRNLRHSGNASMLQLRSLFYYAHADPYDRYLAFDVVGPDGLKCTVEASTNLVDWTSIAVDAILSTGSVSVVDYSVQELDQRFYRAKAGDIRSLNAIGFAFVTVAPGFNFIANPLNSPNNTLGVLIRAAPDGMQAQKTNPSLTSTFDALDMQWTSPYLSLNPGEGAQLYNPSGSSLIYIFLGEVMQGFLRNSITNGDFRSSVAPQAGPISSLLGFPPLDGDQVVLYRSGQQTHTYDALLPGWQPSEPATGVGESFRVFTATPRNWDRTFTIWP